MRKSLALITIALGICLPLAGCSAATGSAPTHTAMTAAGATSTPSAPAPAKTVKSVPAPTAGCVWVSTADATQILGATATPHPTSSQGASLDQCEYFASDNNADLVYEVFNYTTAAAATQAFAAKTSSAGSDLGVGDQSWGQPNGSGANADFRDGQFLTSIVLLNVPNALDVAKTVQAKIATHL